MSKIFKPRRGSATTMNGSKASTVLAEGELFFEYPSTGVGTGECKIKLGDGSTAYSSLPYAIDGTAISSKKVTVTSNSSSTITAALNNVATGKTLGVIVGALKQAVSLCNTSITALNDEMESLGGGSGGIQWNASSKYIQLLSSDGSTWVNWKYYDPTRSFEFVESNKAGSEMKYTCQYNGYYVAIAISTSNNSFGVPSSTGVNLYTAYTNYASVNACVYNCTVGKTITIPASNNANALSTILYIGSGYSGISLLSRRDDISVAGSFSNSISSVNSLLIGMRINYAYGASNATTVQSDADNYKQISVENTRDMGCLPRITCVLSSQTKSITMTQQISYASQTWSQSHFFAFQLV